MASEHLQPTSSSTQMVYIDASQLEGGGQLPRMALCLSALTLKPIRLSKIRANRSTKDFPRVESLDTKRSHRPRAVKPGQNGGLKESHLAALNFLAEACDADVTGAELGSRDVEFTPGATRQPPQSTTEAKNNGEARLEARIELRKPGSVLLIFQALYPYIIFNSKHYLSNPTLSDSRKLTDLDNNANDGLTSSKSFTHTAPSRTSPQVFSLTLIGGTNVHAAISVDRMQQVFIPIARKIGLPEMTVSCKKRGWAGPASEKGEVRIDIHLPPPHFNLPAFHIQDRGKITKIVITVLADSTAIRDSIIQKITDKLLANLDEDVDIEVAVNEASGHASRLFLMLVAHTSNGWRIANDYLHPSSPPHHNRTRTNREKEELRMIEAAVSAVVSEIISEIEGGACVDSNMRDQLVMFQALARGRSVVRGKDDEGTLHARTARWVCEQILGGVKFERDGNCRGVGFNVEAGIEQGVEGLEI